MKAKPMKQVGTEAGALAAIRFAVTNLEQTMVHTILTTPEKNRPYVMNCMLLEIKECITVVSTRCRPNPDPGTGDQGPDPGPECQDGWVPLNGYCIPKPEEPGGEG